MVEKLSLIKHAAFQLRFCIPNTANDTHVEFKVTGLARCLFQEKFGGADVKPTVESFNNGG